MHTYCIFIVRDSHRSCSRRFEIVDVDGSFYDCNVDYVRMIVLVLSVIAMSVNVVYRGRGDSNRCSVVLAKALATYRY